MPGKTVLSLAKAGAWAGEIAARVKYLVQSLASKINSLKSCKEKTIPENCLTKHMLNKHACTPTSYTHKLTIIQKVVIWSELNLAEGAPW